MYLNDVYDAVRAAKVDIRLGDVTARKVADLCAGRLRIANVDGATCAALKRELRDFSLATYQWRDK
jgi:hypothetical protein